MTKPRCPSCGKELTSLYYTEHGKKVLKDNIWVEDDFAGDIEFRCPECDQELEYEELLALGVIG